MKRICYILIFLSLYLAAFAQKGKFYLTHYAPTNDQLTNDNFAIMQDAKQQMLFANSKGVLKFDGRYWQLINTPSTALSIANYKVEEENFIGCIDDIGYIEIDRSGGEIYKSIASFKTKPAYFSKVVTNATYAYFLGKDVLIQYSKSERKITGKWAASSGYFFSHLFNIGENIFAFDPQMGFFGFEQGKLAALKTDITSLPSLAFAGMADADRAILGTGNGKLFFFNGVSLTALATEDSTYLKNSVPFDAVLLNPNLLAIATAKGGVVLLNPTNGASVSIVNFYSGLPDDEILSIGKDSQSGLWIAHEFGLTRLDYFLPFKNYSAFPGLDGNITSALTYQNKIYSGTNEGLFSLEKVTDYAALAKVLNQKRKLNVKEKDAAIERNRKKSTQKKNVLSQLRDFFATENAEPAKLEPQAQTNEAKAKEKRFLGIFKRKQKDEPTVTKSTPAKVEVIKPVAKPTPKPAPVRVKRVIPKIISPKVVKNLDLETVTYAYKRIGGIDGKVRQLMLYNGKLIVLTNNGLYELSGNVVKKIYNEPVTCVYVSKDKTLLYVATDSRSLLVFRVNGADYTELKNIGGFTEKISGIGEDEARNVWMCFNNYLIKFNDRNLVAPDTLKIENPFSEDVHLISQNGKMYFLLNSSAYYYDESKKKIIADTMLIKANNGFLKIIHSQTSAVWYQSENEWKVFSEVAKANPNFMYLSLIKDILQIYVDEDQKNLWIATKSNNLYQFDISNKSELKFTQNIFLRSISDKKGNQLDIRKIELNEESGNVSFAFINPEYIDNQSLQYQYKLLGMSENWSEWNVDNKIIFNYLPSGKYELIVRTKNALNQIRESQPLKFSVRPPYWKEWWFYLGELVFFGGLLLLSIWLNNVTNQKNEWISKGLTFLTIVMMIEFINTIFESYLKFQDSPVLSFLIQVFLAILILPFERILSKFIVHDSKRTIAAVKNVTRKPNKKLDGENEAGQNEN